MFRIRNVYPGSFFFHSGSQIGSRIPDPRSDPGCKNKKKEEGLKLVIFFVALNFTKLKIILFLNGYRKNLWANWQRIKVCLTINRVTKLTECLYERVDIRVFVNLVNVLAPGYGSGSALPIGIRIHNTALNHQPGWAIPCYIFSSIRTFSLVSMVPV
jgi:hypothetical protein